MTTLDKIAKRHPFPWRFFRTIRNSMKIVDADCPEDHYEDDHVIIGRLRYGTPEDQDLAHYILHALNRTEN